MSADQQNIGEYYLKTAFKTFQSQKRLAERAMAQLNSKEFHWTPDSESNSIAIIIKHLSGNMRSRWTDFLTTDGEKPDRNRDNEFVDDIESTEALMARWNEGWNCLFSTLMGLTSSDVLKNVTIRGKQHYVLEAIERQISHYSVHIGQIVYIAKLLKSTSWQSLSIPRGQSERFNAEMRSKHQR
ncbi:MAG: DUF1572 family protein [Promethearchaeota archaeon]